MSDDLRINLQSSVERSTDSTGERGAMETGCNNFPVPVQAEPRLGITTDHAVSKPSLATGEARESTQSRPTYGLESRGGENNLSAPDKVPHQHPTDDGNQRRVSQSDSLVDSAAVSSGAQNFQPKGGDAKCKFQTTSSAQSQGTRSSAAPTFDPEGAACPQSELAPVATGEKQPSMRPSPISGVTPPVHTRWKKGCPSPNPGGRAKHVSRAYIKHLETVVDKETGETNADLIAKEQIRKASSAKDDGSTAAAREIRQATEGDEEAGKGGFNVGSLNVAILQQITRAATERISE